MANALNADTLKVALRSIDEFAARELPDSLLIELDERDEFPEEIVRRMSSGDELGIQKDRPRDQRRCRTATGRRARQSRRLRRLARVDA